MATRSHIPLMLLAICCLASAGMFISFQATSYAFRVRLGVIRYMCVCLFEEQKHLLNRSLLHTSVCEP